MKNGYIADGDGVVVATLYMVPAEPVERDGALWIGAVEMIEGYRFVECDPSGVRAGQPAPAVAIPKMTIVERLQAAALRTAFKAALSADDYQQDRWDAASVIMSDDIGMRGVLAAAGADADEILAPV